MRRRIGLAMESNRHHGIADRRWSKCPFPAVARQSAGVRARERTDVSNLPIGEENMSIATKHRPSHMPM